MRSRPRVAGWAAFGASLLAVSLAFGQAKATPEARRAKALFEEGVALSDEGKWADALSAFQKSDELQPSASARYNIGATLRALGRYVEATKLLEQVLADGASSKTPLKPALKKDIEKLLAEVKAKVVTVRLKLSPVNADVQMDGAPVSPGPDGKLAVDPGKHVFVVSAKGYDTTTVSQSLSSNDVEVVLTAPKTVEKVQVVEVKQTPVYARAWFIATLSVAVAGGAAVGIVFATRPKETPPAGPPQATVEHVIPAAWRF
jgi:hypothetical protein